MAIAIDFETYLISNEAPSPKPVCLSFYSPSLKEGLIVGHENMEKFLKAILESDELIIAHNAKFENLVIYNHFPALKQLLVKKIESNGIYCTKLAEVMIGNTRKKQAFKFALSDLVLNYFKEDISATKKDPDAWRLRYSELDGIPKSEWPQAAVDYAIDDSIWAYKVWELQKYVKLDYFEEVKSDFYLGLMGYNGLLVSKERVKEIEDEILGKLNPTYQFLIENNLGSFDKKTGKFKKKLKNLQQYIDKTFQNPIKTAKGIISTTSLSMTQYLGEKDDQVIRQFLYLADYEKIISTFTPRLLKADPVIRTEYNSYVSTGRTSSRTSLAFPSVNIQQMPRALKDCKWDIRNCFVPRPGYKICSIDYSGLELACTAHQLKEYYGDSLMNDIINSGDSPVDMHSKLACQIMSLKTGTTVTYDHFVKHKKEKEYAAYRQLSKPINLGFPGGIGYDTMRELLFKEGILPKFQVLEKFTCEKFANRVCSKLKDMNPALRVKRTGKWEWSIVYDELVLLKNALLDLYPRLKDFLTNSHEAFQTGSSKMVENEFGEWEKEPMHMYHVGHVIRDNCNYTALCNGFLMQSPAAVGAKEMVRRFVNKYQEDDRVIPLAFIHDEIVFEVKEGPEMESIVDDVAEIMIDSMQAKLPTVRIAVEAEVMDYWMKSGGFLSKTYWKNVGESKLYIKG